MRFFFYAIALGLPILDIATLVEAGRWIGAWPTIGMVLLSATIGVMLVRAQGLAILTQARATLNQGAFPAREVFDGACALIGGALLVLPGFISDVLGLMLLLPPARSLLRRLISREIRRSGRFAIWTVERQPTREDGTGPVIEGEFETIQPAGPPKRGQPEDDDAQHRRSPWHR
jgi:UPF0716 protein FxsA